MAILAPKALGFALLCKTYLTFPFISFASTCLKINLIPSICKVMLTSGLNFFVFAHNQSNCFGK